jgi:lysozyme
MARIQTADTLGTPGISAVRGTPDINAAALTAPARAQAESAGIMSKAADALANVAGVFAKKQEETDDYETKKRYIDFDLAQEKRYEDMKANPDKDAKGFTSGFREGYDAEAKEFFKGVPESQKAQYDYLLTNRGAQFEKRAYDFENSERDRQHREDLDGTLLGLRNLTAEQPDKYRDNIARGVTIIDSSRLPPAEKDKAKKAFAQGAEEDAIRARISRGDDIEQVLKDIERRPIDQAAPKLGRTMDESGFEAIRQNEGFAPVAKRDGKYGYSAGFGSYGVKPGTRMSREEADEAMKREVAAIESEMAEKIKVPLTQGQHNALVDTFYTMGTGRGRNSKGPARLDQVAELINDGKGDAVPGWLMQYTRQDGRVLDGLVTRRQRAVDMWNSAGDTNYDTSVEKSVSGVPVRQPTESELEYFKQNPKVAGMAAEDNQIILNPHSGLTPEQQSSVAQNEAARVWMRRDGLSPTFELTPEQKQQFAEYGSEQDQKATVAARILSGDPSAGAATPEQSAFVEKLKTAMDGPVQVDATPAPYRHLKPEQRLRLINVAKIAGRADMQAKIDEDVEFIRHNGKPKHLDGDVDTAKTSLERSSSFMTEHQHQVNTRKWKEAELEYKAISPLGDMSEDEALTHLGNILPDAEADDDNYASAQRVMTKATQKWDQIQKARKTDPALAVNQAPEVREAFDLIRETGQNKGMPGVTVQQPGISPVKAQEMVIEARVAAQKRLGLRDYELPITRKQALDLLDMPDPGQLSEKQWKDGLRAASDRANEIYGPKWGKPVFEAAVKFVANSKAERDMAAPIIRKMVTGEGVTPADVRMAERAAQLDLADRLFVPNEYMESAPTMRTPLAPSSGMSFNEAKKPGSWPTPKPEAIADLKRDPKLHAAFARKYGPVAAEEALRGKTDAKK